jgi:hypothetical protein
VLLSGLFSPKSFKSARAETDRLCCSALRNDAHNGLAQGLQLGTGEEASRPAPCPRPCTPHALHPEPCIPGAPPQDSPNGSCSVLKVETRDRPGLLVDIVAVLKDINVNVVSAEVDTIGDQVCARAEGFEQCDLRQCGGWPCSARAAYQHSTNQEVAMLCCSARAACPAEELLRWSLGQTQRWLMNTASLHEGMAKLTVP